MEFGDRLKQLRLERKLTQKELGELLNLSDRVVGYYETNERFPRDPNTIKDIASYFNVTTDYLLGLSDVRNPYANNYIKLKTNNKVVDKDPLDGFDIAAHKIEPDKEFSQEQKEYIAKLVNDILKDKDN